ncbi:type II secretion system F family protein [Virgibacillus sp. MG-45]|uniref:type II secretion system F family protein n=1 Tax=Virgibacillus sp. MG-45 TaxID=3102791 RepID=UPI002EDA3A11
MAILIKRFYKKQSFKSEHHLRFLRVLSRALANGYPFISALETMMWDKNLNQAASIMMKALKSGETVDKAFDKAGFHPSITSYLFFANKSGELTSSIKKGLQLYEKRLQYTQKLYHVSRYPLLLFLLFTGLLIVIKQIVLPTFSDLFQNGSTASTSVNFSIIMIDLFIQLFFTLLLLTLFTAFLFQRFNKKISIETLVAIYRSIPIYRKLISMYHSFLFATHLSTLLKTGISMKEVLSILSKQTKHPVLAHYCTVINSGLLQGVHISSMITELSLLQPQFAAIFQKNSDVITLEKDLTVYADLLIERFHHQMMKLISMIHPIFFIVIGAFIIFIYVTLMWPMFELIQSL